MSQPAFPGHLTSQDPDLDERARRIFATLVELHAATARPIGSESLAQQGDIPISSASVRATLAELEGLGLLERSHSSAGRVPTPRGFEFYVRRMLTPAVLDTEAIAEVDRVLSRSARDVEQLLLDASRLLSSLTHQLGLALASSLEQEVLRGLDLTALDARRVLLVLNLGVGAVRTVVLELESALDPAELEEVAGVLRERLIGYTLSEVRERLEYDPELVRRSAVRIVAAATSRGLAEPVETPLFRSGAMHFAEQPEFLRPTRLGPLLQAVETGSPLDRLLIGGIEGQVSVRVGIDEDLALTNCSLVAYPLPGMVRAAVGVLGPLRMNYSLAFAVVDRVGTRVAELLQS